MYSFTDRALEGHSALAVGVSRLSLVTAWYMDAGIQPNTFEDWAKLEGSRSQ